MRTTTEELLNKSKQLEGELAGPIQELKDQCGRLFKAATKVAESWSGSFFGYHSELYYGDFERPPVDCSAVVW